MNETTKDLGHVTAIPEDDHGFPVPRVPLTPPMTSAALGKTSSPAHSLLQLPHLCVSAGRAAIALALRHAGITRGDEVLVPAYHCESMVAPIAHVGATPTFYRVDADAAVDVADVEDRVTPNTRAIIVTHYFGFPQKIRALRELCDARDLVLIEDCAHAFFGRADGLPLGAYGDYAIGSAMKFFPLFDGGILASSKHDLSHLALFRPSALLDLKAAFNMIEYALRYERLGMVRVPIKLVLSVKDALWSIIKGAGGDVARKPRSPAASEGGFSLEPEWIDARMSRVSRFVMTHADGARICTGRRRNYLELRDALAEIPGMRPLHAELGDDVVPLVLPMIVERPPALFAPLKRRGVPIWRFGEHLHPAIVESEYPHTVRLSRQVFQFPCHPELRPDEKQWMVETIRTHAREAGP